MRLFYCGGVPREHPSPVISRCAIPKQKKEPSNFWKARSLAHPQGNAVNIYAIVDITDFLIPAPGKRTYRQLLPAALRLLQPDVRHHCQNQ